MSQPDATDQTTPNPLLRFLRRLAGGGEATLTGDVNLLQRFVQDADRAAFELLLWRHGPMVLQVCRTVLHDAHDAEDAFQAAFLVLARKAGSIGRRKALSAWLYRVAHRIAVKLDQQRRRRTCREQQGLDLAALGEEPPTRDPAAEEEIKRLLHAEVERLPAKYRAPVVLCYLEGRTNEEAAAQLGWSKGTISGRLARARDLLRRRLERCGLLAVGGLSMTLLAGDANAALPVALVAPTLHAVVAAAAGGSLTAAASPKVIALVEGALTTMAASKFKLLTGLLLLSLSAAVAIAFTGTAASPGAGGTQPATGQPGPAPPKKPTRHRVASPIDGIVVAVGTAITKKAEPAIAGARKVEVKIGKYVRTFWVLKEGDTVEQGQMLVQLDDQLALNDRLYKKAKGIAAQADHAAALATAKEARERLRRLERLLMVNKGLVSAEDYGAAKLTCEKYAQEEIAKREGITLARLEFEQAEILLERYAIRSPLRGVVRAIRKQAGEGVRALETLLEIEAIEKK